MIVLSDTSPLNYLILIGCEEILPNLFGEIIAPAAVCEELLQPATPDAVRRWMEQPPSWLVVRKAAQIDQELQLGAGEVEAISLAVELHATLLLMDDRVARRAAEARGLPVAGTVNVLEKAARRDLIDLNAAIAKLRDTSFRIAPHVLDAALKADARRRGS